MKAQKIYEKETGNVAPSHQIAHGEWYIKYVEWLERQVEKQYRALGKII
jgi:hypothetical protein